MSNLGETVGACGWSGTKYFSSSLWEPEEGCEGKMRLQIEIHWAVGHRDKNTVKLLNKPQTEGEENESDITFVFRQ